MKVFVYGTLRSGDCRFEVESFVEVIASEAHIEGFDMLDFGGFPGLIQGENRIRGEVHEYENLKILDRIEGYNERAPKTGLYNRCLVTAETPEGKIEDCWVYTFNKDEAHDYEEDIIKCGDWFEHRGYYEQLELGS